jgi:predicted nicotinamide N-methyase
MGEAGATGLGLIGGGVEAIVGVPLATFEFNLGGRTWHIQAARDHASLMVAADRFVTFPFGLLLWESGQALAEALVERSDEVAGRTILELGAGVGMPGIIARALGAAAVRQTDHSSESLALCRANAEANRVDGIEVALANWDAWTDTRTYDLIIGSDVVYERAAHAPLAAILERNLASGGRVLLADPGRQDTPLFLADLAAADWRSVQGKRIVPAMLPGGAENVEIDIIELWR